MTDPRYRFDLAGLPLDVLNLEGHEHLSQVFTYRVRCTSARHDIGRDEVLTQPATLRLCSALSLKWSAGPLRSVPGVITGFAHLRTSVDETLYEFTLQPRLALLARGQGSHLYRNLSVPQIVEQVLCQRHGWPAPALEASDLLHAYPALEQVMQFEESDLAFIERLLAEAGIWYHLAMHETLDSEVMVLGDRAAEHYLPPMTLPVRPQSGQPSEEEAVWDVQSLHQVVEQSASVHHYAYRQRLGEQDGPQWLRADDTNSDFGNLSAQGTYGDACHLGMAYETKGSENQARALFTENTGYRAAHQGHERYLNQRTRLRGNTRCVQIVPGRVLKLEGSPSGRAPEPTLLERGLLVTSIHVTAARDRDLNIHFEGLPNGEIEFRPALKPKPVMAGTVAAFVTAEQPPEADLDEDGHYRVHFAFDRRERTQASASKPLRLARPYAGKHYGLHLPLRPGTEVAVAFEHGDPDRPYIAHALHDHCLADVVTRTNQTRNVLRTPANNKLRMEDKPGAEHVKLSTEHGGKSQLNLGHLVGSDASQVRGEGFELRTDARGAIRAGQGLFISADAQARAQGVVLEMDAALEQLGAALQLVKDLAHSVAMAGASCADEQAQRELEMALNRLQGAGLLASAPAGVAVVTPSQLQLSAGGNLIATAGDSLDLSVVKRVALAAGERVSLFAQSAGMQLLAGQGDIQVHAKSASLDLQAQQNINLAAHQGEMVLHAEQGITLACRGAYLTLKDGSIEIGAPGKVMVRNDNVEWGGGAAKGLNAAPLQQSETFFHQLLKGRFQVVDSATGAPKPEVAYCISAGDGAVAEGVTDGEGKTMPVHSGKAEPVVLAPQ